MVYGSGVKRVGCEEGGKGGHQRVLDTEFIPKPKHLVGVDRS